MTERELYVDKIKANQRGIGPLARRVNGPHANLHDSSRWVPQKRIKDDAPHNRDPKHVEVGNWG
jgi:hypothetical protein